MHKQVRATHRARPSLGMDRLTQWHRCALSAYTWTRTNRGPMRQWLFKINKADDLRCPACQHHTQGGDHIVFHCPALQPQRFQLIGTRDGDAWEHLDHPLLIKAPQRQTDNRTGQRLSSWQFSISLPNFPTNLLTQYCRQFKLNLKFNLRPFQVISGHFQ